MSYKEALIKLERLLGLIEQYMPIMHDSTPEAKQLSRQICDAYGEVEDIIERVEGHREVEVPTQRGGLKAETYPNFIEAGFLSGFSIHAGQGYRQLLKIIGKVRKLAADPSILRDEASINSLIRALRRFRECCQFVREPPKAERDVKDIIWIMLRSQFDRVDRDDTLPRFGAKSYKPDFGVPELGVLIEKASKPQALAWG